MLKGLARVFLVLAICTSIPVDYRGQSARSGKSQSGSQKAQKRDTQPAPEPARENSPPAGEEETVKIDTDLVTVPVIATDKNGLYIPNLKQNEFTIAEDNVQQEIAFFATINVPFHVVLMLDTSASTREKLNLIQQAAGAFVDQLQSADRVKVISFDDAVVAQNEFTSDRALLKAAINNRPRNFPPLAYSGSRHRGLRRQLFPAAIQIQCQLLDAPVKPDRSAYPCRMRSCVADVKVKNVNVIVVIVTLMAGREIVYPQQTLVDQVLTGVGRMGEPIQGRRTPAEEELPGTKAILSTRCWTCFT